MIDLHTHHARCGHAEGSLEEVARNALAAGIRVFGWSDHAPRFGEAEDHPRPDVQMARSQWDPYLREAVAVRATLRRQAPDFDVRIGVEADYLAGTEEAYAAALDRPELDYVLGSVHEVGPWQIFHPRSWADLDDTDRFHRAYWEAQRASAASGLFDVIAHLDAIKTFLAPATSDLTGEVEATLDCIADCGVAVEINGSGLRKVGELYPAPELVAGLVRRDVPITIGSDAHRPEQLGMGWSEACVLLAGLGRTTVVTFRQREPVEVALP